MGFLEKIVGKKNGSRPQEAVLIHFDGTQVANEFWSVQERLYEVVEQSGAGEFDGNEVGGESATFFAYGPDAVRLFEVMQSVLNDCSQLRGARVVLRKGGPGAPETELKL